MSTGSLTGIKVVDVSRMLPGPYCSMILADHGADVVAIEDRRFADDGLFFASLYRNKKHLSLNLKTEQGKQIFNRLVADADVVIEGFRPGVAQRLGIDYETLRQIRPEIIYCSITGYGQTGPNKMAAGHDINYVSTAGILDLVGMENGPPIIPGVQIADIFGGAMQAVAGILMALVARGRTGRGQYIDISMTDGLLGLLALPFELAGREAHSPRRSNDLLSHRFACYNVYQTADQRYIAVGALEHRFWSRLCALLEVPDFEEAQYDEQRREEVIDGLRTVFISRTADQWEALFAGEDVCCTVVRRPDEIAVLPQFVRREMVFVDDRNERCKNPVLGIPIKLSDTPGSLRTDPVSFGANSDEILRDLGYSESQIGELRASEVI